MLQATAEATLLSLSSELKKQYDNDVSTALAGPDRVGRALSSNEFNTLISNQQALILTKFDSVKKLGDDDLIKKFRDNLLDDVKTQSNRFREQNENRRLATSWKTPATLILTNIFAQIVAFILRALFLGPVAGVFGVIQILGWIRKWGGTVFQRMHKFCFFVEILRSKPSSQRSASGPTGPTPSSTKPCVKESTN